MIAGVYAELALMGKKAERQDAAERLFAINRGALLRNGTRLPVKLQIDDIRLERTLKRAATAAGFKTTRLDPPRYILSFGPGREGYISCELYDGGKGITVFKQNLPQPEAGGPSAAAFARALRDGVFDAF
jgi:hypothetical protein